MVKNLHLRKALGQDRFMSKLYQCFEDHMIQCYLKHIQVWEFINLFYEVAKSWYLLNWTALQKKTVDKYYKYMSIYTKVCWETDSIGLVFLHVLQTGTNCPFCSRLYFQGCLYGEQPWETVIEPLSVILSRFAYCLV